MRIQNKILFVSLCSVVFLSSLIILFIQTVLPEHLETELQKRGRDISRDLANVSSEYILSGDEQALKMTVIKHTEAIEDIEYAFILDTDGRVLAHTFGNALPENLRNGNNLKSGTGFNPKSIATEKGEVIDMAVPIANGKLGVVHVGMSKAPVAEFTAHVTQIFSAGIIAILIFGTAIAAFITARITRPIRKLTEAAEEVGKGNLDYRVDISTRDELGILASSFNKMLQHLKTANEELKTANMEIKHESAERRKAEELASDAKNIWEKTFDINTDMITIHDKDFNIIRANKNARKLLKLPLLDIDKNTKCYKYYHGQEGPPDGCPSCLALKTGQPGIFEFFEPHLNMFIEIRAIPTFDDNNQLTGLIHFVRDITQRKRSDEIVQRQLNRLNAIQSIERAITSSLDLRLTLDILLTQITSQLGIDAASVLLLNSETNILEYVVSKGFRTTALRYTRLKLGESNAGRAAIEGRIINISNLKRDVDGFTRSELFPNEEFVTYFAVPLMTKGEVKGVMELFHRSPLEAEKEFMEFLETVADQAATAIDNAGLFEKLQRSNIELSLAYDTTIEGWSRALDMRDRETEGHSERVAEMTVQIAAELGIKKDEFIHIRRGALLHDIGKMSVPDSILLKPGPLSEEEWELMKLHPVYAYNLLRPIEYLRSALDIPYYHHEKWDGTGYPTGLKGAAIPLSARIFAVVDIWDALNSDRPYRPAWSEDKIIKHIKSLSGNHLDPLVVETFFKVLKKIREQT